MNPFRYHGVLKTTAKQWDQQLRDGDWKPARVSGRGNNPAFGWYYRKYYCQTQDGIINIGQDMFQVFNPITKVSYISNNGYPSTEEFEILSGSKPLETIKRFHISKKRKRKVCSRQRFFDQIHENSYNGANSLKKSTKKRKILNLGSKSALHDIHQPVLPLHERKEQNVVQALSTETKRSKERSKILKQTITKLSKDLTREVIKFESALELQTEILKEKSVKLRESYDKKVEALQEEGERKLSVLRVKFNQAERLYHTRIQSLNEEIINYSRSRVQIQSSDATDSWHQLLSGIIYKQLLSHLKKRSPLARQQGEAFGFRKTTTTIKTHGITNFVYKVFNDHIPQNFIEGYTVDMLKEKLKLADELCEYILENMRLSSCNKDALCTLILKFNAIPNPNMKKPELIDHLKTMMQRDVKGHIVSIDERRSVSIRYTKTATSVSVECASYRRVQFATLGNVWLELGSNDSDQDLRRDILRREI